MGVMLQAFYWNCPEDEGGAGNWWPAVSRQLPEIKDAGFTALWLPPPSKAFSTTSMGYDVYDYYDLGDLDQKGGRATYFGTGHDLRELIAAAHEPRSIQVYADVVLNHNSGADEREPNPIDGAMRWTRFSPGSGRFPRDWTCFHPCDFESWDGYEMEGEMPDLCHRNPRVYRELMDWARWLVEEVGFDGFRYDMVKGYGPWVVGAIQEYRYRRAGAEYCKPFGVGEYWDASGPLEAWLAEASDRSDNPVSAFDFPLRDRLRRLCAEDDFDLGELPRPGALYRDRPRQAVTFVENHDLAEPHPNPSPVIRDKMLAYAFILTHEGYPCVFWRDWFDYGLAQVGWRSGISALVEAHERSAVGPTEVLAADSGFYAMQRTGLDGQGGLVFVLNARRDGWQGRLLRTTWRNRRLVPAAWRSEGSASTPAEVWTRGDGQVDLWAPPRGYVVYTPA